MRPRFEVAPVRDPHEVRFWCLVTRDSDDLPQFQILRAAEAKLVRKRMVTIPGFVALLEIIVRPTHNHISVRDHTGTMHTLCITPPDARLNTFARALRTAVLKETPSWATALLFCMLGTGLMLSSITEPHPRK